MDTLDLPVALEEACKSEGVARRTLHPKRERLQPSAKEKGGERVEDRADVDEVVAGTGDHLGASCEHAGSHIVVAVQVLGRRLADDVGAELERTAEHWRCKSVVNYENAVALPLGEGPQVGDRDGRVGDRLDVEDSRRALPRG